MIVLERLVKCCLATVAESGAVLEIPAGCRGAFIIHRDQPVMFYYDGNLCLVNRDAFSEATGSTQEQMENLDALAREAENQPVYDDIEEGEE